MVEGLWRRPNAVSALPTVPKRVALGELPPEHSPEVKARVQWMRACLLKGRSGSDETRRVCHVAPDDQFANRRRTITSPDASTVTASSTPKSGIR